MKKIFASIIIILVGFIIGTSINYNNVTSANENDDFSTGTLNHGLEYDYLDTTADAESPFNPLLHPSSHYKPNRIDLYNGENPGFGVNGRSVIVQPLDIPTLPEASTENYVVVLNQIRQVLIDSNLAQAPDTKSRKVYIKGRKK